MIVAPLGTYIQWFEERMGASRSFTIAAAVDAALLMLTTGIAFAPSVNNQGFTSPQYEQLIGSIASEPDASKRQTVYAQLNDLLLDESFDMPLATAPARMVTTSAVQGVGYSVGQPLYTSAWLG